MKIALLDDYQSVAIEMADWDALSAAEVTAFADHLVDEDQLVARLSGFDVIMAMRERTPFERALFARLPKLKLLVTSGMHNAAIDLEAATEHGVIVCGTSGRLFATAELTWVRSYDWQIAHCGACSVQLGWLFTGEQAPAVFFGLIRPRLTDRAP